jgi:lipid-A-disaccharide synthase
MSQRDPLIFIVAGEASGDILAGRLMAALKAETGGRIRFAGIGGPQSEQQGLTSLFPMRELSLLGLAEILPHLPRLVRRLKETAGAVRSLEPDAVVTVDSPGFCLRLAHYLRGSGIPVIHYVAPQLWAWRPGRVRKLAKRIDHLMALLPFEVAFFDKHGIPCTYVGHPAVQAASALGDGPAFRARHDIPQNAPLLCVAPGSRAGELRRMLPAFEGAVRLLKENHGDLHVVIPVAQAATEMIGDATRDWPVPVILLTDSSERFDAFAACDAALSKSGTVTFELALADVPMAVAYRVSPPTAFLVGLMVKVRHASLVNLLTGREVVPEFIQQACTAPRLAETVGNLLDSKEAREAQREGFREMRAVLGEPDPPPSERAAKVVLDIVRARAPSK